MTRSWSLITLLGLVLLFSGLLLEDRLIALALPYLLFSFIPFWRKAKNGVNTDRPLNPTFGPTRPAKCPCPFEHWSGPGRSVRFGCASGWVTLWKEIPPLRDASNPARPDPSLTIRGVRGKYEFPVSGFRQMTFSACRGRQRLSLCHKRLQFFPRLKDWKA